MSLFERNTFNFKVGGFSGWPKMLFVARLSCPERTRRVRGERSDESVTPKFAGLGNSVELSAATRNSMHLFQALGKPSPKPPPLTLRVVSGHERRATAAFL